MLFHVTMTHTEDNCPAYDREKMSQFIAEADQIEARAKQLGVKIHHVLWGAPEHIAYALVEADSTGAVAQLVFSLSIRQDFQVTPVQNLKEVVAMGKALAARA